MPKRHKRLLVVLLSSLATSTVFAPGTVGDVWGANDISEPGVILSANRPDAARPGGAQSPRTRQSSCEVSGRVPISPQAVGRLPVAAPIRQLLTICRGVHTMREAEEHSYPAVEFHVGGLTVLASQTIEADSVKSDDPADTWEVKGANGVLPMGVSLRSSWTQLRRAYGAAVVNTVFDEVEVMFCRFPNMSLYLDTDIEALRPIDGNELTRIPSDAKIVRVIISSWPFGGSRCVGVER